MAVASDLDWRVTGSYFEACNCEAICPCRSIGGRDGGRSTMGICQFALSWFVEDGHVGDVALDGLAVVMAGFYSDDEPRSPWRVCLYVDERARDDQAALLADIFLGRLGGGTYANFAAAIADVHAVRSARIELEHEPGAWAIGVEGYVRVTAGEVVDSEEPVSCGIPGHDRAGKELRCQVMHVDDEPLAWEFHGRCGFTSTFDYANTA